MIFSSTSIFISCRFATSRPSSFSILKRNLNAFVNKDFVVKLFFVKGLVERDLRPGRTDLFCYTLIQGNTATTTNDCQTSVKISTSRCDDYSSQIAISISQIYLRSLTGLLLLNLVLLARYTWEMT